MPDDLPDDPIERAAKYRKKRGHGEGNAPPVANESHDGGGSPKECPVCGDMTTNLPRHIRGGCETIAEDKDETEVEYPSLERAIMCLCWAVSPDKDVDIQKTVKEAELSIQQWRIDQRKD